MTPSEKAIELVHRFYSEGIKIGYNGNANFSSDLNSPRKQNAIKCAFICTEEIIMNEHTYPEQDHQYWYEVQKEIEKL